MRSLGRRWGADAPRLDVDVAGPVRDLGALALENEVEGCVRETYGALVATWQAVHARDRQVRAAMKEIAREETQHAALAWEVARWAGARLDAEVRRRVADARKRALDELAAEIATDPPQELVEVLGLPTRARAARLLDGMIGRLRMATP